MNPQAAEQHVADDAAFGLGNERQHRVASGAQRIDEVGFVRLSKCGQFNRADRLGVAGTLRADVQRRLSRNRATWSRPSMLRSFPSWHANS